MMTFSTSSIGRKLAIVTAGSAVLLLTVVLPAEYGIDLTGFGKLTGLNALARSTAGSEGQFEGTLQFNVEDHDPNAEQIDRSIKGLIHLEEQPYRTETIDLKIEDLGEIEYKFVMEADSALVYSWQLLEGKGEGVYYSLHGHPSSADAPNYLDGFAMDYSKGEGQAQNGSFTAPFPGYHGWYLMNLEEGPVTVRLTVSGYWNEHKEMYRAVDGKVVNNVEF